MKLLKILLRYSPVGLLLAVVAGGVSGLANAGLLAVINEVLAASDGLRAADGWRFLALFLMVPLTSVLSSYLLVRLGQRAVLDLRLRLARRILSAPLRTLEEIGPHRLLVALTQDIASVAVALAGVPALAVNVMIVVGSLVYMAYLSMPMFAGLLVAILLGAASYQLPVMAAQRRLREARRGVDTIYGHFRALTEGLKELKLHRRRRGEFLDLLEDDGVRFRDMNVGATMIYRAAGAWGGVIVFAIIGVGLFLAPRYLEVTSETLTGFVLVLLYMSMPMQGLLGVLPDLGRAEVAVDTIERLGISLAQAAEPEEAVAAPGFATLELNGVEHTYFHEGEQRNFTLGPIDLAIAAGELVFLVGGNGSGKTTLAKVLVGLYAPQAGEVLFDGKPLDDDSRHRLRECFSVVFSDFYVFERLLGLAADDLDERARFYLERLQLEHKVEVRDGALSTTKLSQGQRKRLALLTAYLEDRPCYLFDEWAADQDPLFKHIFYRELLPELKRRGKTVIVISHDDRYYDVADRILKLDSGRLVGSFEARDLAGLEHWNQGTPEREGGELDTARAVASARRS